MSTEQEVTPKNYIPDRIYSKLPLMVKDEITKLSASKQEAFLEEYNRKRKDVATIYLLWFLLGWHYGLGFQKWGTQILYWITFGGFFLWMVIDAIRIPGMVDEYNKDIALSTMRNLTSMNRQ